MTEPNETGATPTRTGPPLWRIAIVIGSLIVLAASAALTLAASPSPSASTAPGGATSPTDPDKDWTGPGGFGMRGPGDSFRVHSGAITVTAVSGSNLSLKTDDGWTRTITVTSDTKITKAGATIAVGDIKVGDTIEATYYESVVVQVFEPGMAPSGTTVAAMGAQAAGTKPGGMVAGQATMTVTVMAIDPSIPAVTVQTEDGSNVSFRVQKAKYLKDVKVGDQVTITKTEALAVAVKESK